VPTWIPSTKVVLHTNQPTLGSTSQPSVRPANPRVDQPTLGTTSQPSVRPANPRYDQPTLGTTSQPSVRPANPRYDQPTLSPPTNQQLAPASHSDTATISHTSDAFWGCCAALMAAILHKNRCLVQQRHPSWAQLPTPNQMKQQVLLFPTTHSQNTRQHPNTRQTPRVPTQPTVTPTGRAQTHRHTDTTWSTQPLIEPSTTL
jgi:hypothetical protein